MSRKIKVVILDNNALSIACYLDEHQNLAQKLLKEIKGEVKKC